MGGGGSTESLTISPDPVDPGDDLHISYEDPTRAGNTITIELDNGGTASDEVQITLDDGGHGAGSWTVPQSGWTGIIATGPGGTVDTVSVTP